MLVSHDLFFNKRKTGWGWWGAFPFLNDGICWSPLEIHLPNIYYSPGLVANCVMFTLDSRSTVTSYVEAALVNIVLQQCVVAIQRRDDISESKL